MLENIKALAGLPGYHSWPARKRLEQKCLILSHMEYTWSCVLVILKKPHTTVQHGLYHTLQRFTLTRAFYFTVWRNSVSSRVCRLPGRVLQTCSHEAMLLSYMIHDFASSLREPGNTKDVSPTLCPTLCPPMTMEFLVRFADSSFGPRQYPSKALRASFHYL